jgi:hypothetical protein
MKKITIFAAAIAISFGSMAYAQNPTTGNANGARLNINNPSYNMNKYKGSKAGTGINASTKTSVQSNTLQSGTGIHYGNPNCDGTAKKIQQRLKDGSGSGTGNKFRTGRKK